MQRLSWRATLVLVARQVSLWFFKLLDHHRRGPLTTSPFVARSGSGNLIAGEQLHPTLSYMQ